MESTDVRIANTCTLVNGDNWAGKGAQMAEKSFVDILDQWERSQEKKPEKKAAKAVRFADIYGQWEGTHDESKAISKRSREVSSEVKPSSVTINEIRRMAAQDELDLHEMRLEDAVKATSEFIELCHGRGYRKIRIVTGKGLHSAGGEAVLRPRIEALCRNHSLVREVSFPKASEGGSGALTVILKGK